MIDPDSIVEHYRQRHATVPGCLLEIIEAARNVFIFVPIIVTWFGISQATAKYNDYVSAALAKHDETQLSQPFLYLWQEGFGGRLPGWLTLSNVALMDVIVLVSIFLLTLLAHAISNSNRLREEINARKLHSDLVHAIARATLCLHDKKQQQQLQLVGGPTNKLDQVAQDIQNMANTIMLSFDKLKNDLMMRFDGVVNDFSRQFNQITNDLSAQLQQGSQYLGTMGATATSLLQLAQDMHTAAKDLTDANQEMTKSINALLGPAVNLAQQQQKILQSVDQSVVLLQKNADELKDISKQQTSWSNDLVLSLDAVRSASEKMDEMVTQLGDFVTQQNNLVAEMANERVAQTRLADNMMQSTLSMQDAQKSLHDLAINFRQIAVDTNEVLRLYASLPKNLGTDMAKAMQLIEKGGGDLTDAAMSIFSASQFFEKVVADQEQVIDRLKASGII